MENSLLRIAHHSPPPQPHTCTSPILPPPHLHRLALLPTKHAPVSFTHHPRHRLPPLKSSRHRPQLDDDADELHDLVHTPQTASSPSSCHGNGTARLPARDEAADSSSSNSELSELQASPSLILSSARNLAELLMRIPDWADAQKESGMPQRQKRAFYSHDEWLRHRSSTRHIRHMLSSLSSRVVLSLIPPVFSFTAIAAVIVAYNTAVISGWLPSFLPLLHAASLPYELTAPALALLLVFRTEASYSRYDEARKTWTQVIGSTKDFARQSTQLIRDPGDLALKSGLLNYIMAFPVALKCHLIHGSNVRKDLNTLLDDDDLTLVVSSQHGPNCLIQLMSETLALIQLKESDRILLDSNISQFNASISVCERLIRTPIPLSYTRLTSRFLVVWHLTLPIVLWDSCNWMAVPATLFSSATLFCIEEVGVLIEEPFPMLALDKMCGIAHENIRELVKLQRCAEKHLARKKERSLDGNMNGAGRKGYAFRPDDFLN